MKKVAIITIFASVAEYHKKVLNELFDDAIEIEIFSHDDGSLRRNMCRLIEADVVLTTLYSIYVDVKKHINKDARVILIGTTITQKQYDCILSEIPAESPVMLVNYSLEMTMESMALLRQVGLTEYDFVPVYPGLKDVPRLDTALTLGEREHVPKSVKNITDVGHRTIDIQTISELAVAIGREELIRSEMFAAHFKNLKLPTCGTAVLMDTANILESRFFELLNVIDEGIVATDAEGKIYAMNSKAADMLRLDCSRVGCKVFEIIPGDLTRKAIEERTPIEQQLVSFENRYISLRSVPVKAGGDLKGFLFIINYFEEQEKSQHRLRSQLLGRGYKAKYTFDTIIGSSTAIEKVKGMARKMARSDSSILITGESGVGKELFAQAIHNESMRKNYQFVPVNCAAIPESLLESELFGYEEGAFTGAKKGGKMGLFEIAHKGTIFLDEIGEMPLHLQARFLRVIQEREVMRIGGERIIHVDVRIIAATNKNLREEIKKGNFRGDLFYRLNVLPLSIPPLRDREGDVLMLFECIRDEIGGHFVLAEDAKRFLLRYKWDGNLRELRNCVEYLAYLDKHVIEPGDLKEVISDEAEDLSDLRIESGDAARPGDNGESRLDKRAFVLSCMYDARKDLKGIGRRGILELAKKSEYFITESDIRTILHELVMEGTAEIKKGRGGTCLTQKGIDEVTGWL